MLDILPIKLEKIINIIIKGIIIVLPLFFLPWTSEYLELSKQFLLWLFMPAAVLLWFYQMAAAKRLKFRINPLNLPVLIFLLLAAASSWFSLDRFSSFFGYYGRFSDAWLGWLSLALFYFLIINTEIADNTKKIIDLWKLFLYSAIAVAVIFLLTIFGGYRLVTGSLIFSPLSFNLAGSSLLALGVLLAIVSVSLVYFLSSGRLKKIERIVFNAGLILSLIILLLINFSLSWILLLLGAGLIVFFRWLEQGRLFFKSLDYRWLVSGVLMLVAVFMLALPNARPVKSVAGEAGAKRFNGVNVAEKVLGQAFPQEAALDYGQAFAITKKAVIKNPGLGSGPGTFAADFSLYRPAELNQSDFWQIRFDKSSSHVLEMLATVGLLGALSYFLIVSLLVYLSIVFIGKHFKSQTYFLAALDYGLVTALLTVFILIFFSQLLFLSSTVLNFIFWLTLSLLIAFWQNRHQALFKEKIIDLTESQPARWLFGSVLFILSSGWAILLTFELKFLAADIIAARGFNQEINLLTAIKLNPYGYNYRISLAEIYLNQARAELLKPIEQRNNINIQSNITQAVDMAKQAQTLAPNSVLSQETMGMIYRDSRPLTVGSEAWAVKSFARALELEPTNPVLATELAKAYLNNDEIAKAEKYFAAAWRLKSDYYEAEFWLAKTYIKNKKDNQALELLNDLARRVATAEIYYELGRLYYNRGDIDKAIERFELALSVSPRHLSSLFSLGLAYEARGKTGEALSYFKKASELNPGNEEAIKKIKALSE